MSTYKKKTWKKVILTVLILKKIDFQPSIYFIQSHLSHHIIWTFFLYVYGINILYNNREMLTRYSFWHAWHSNTCKKSTLFFVFKVFLRILTKKGCVNSRSKTTLLLLFTTSVPPPGTICLHISAFAAYILEFYNVVYYT